MRFDEILLCLVVNLHVYNYHCAAVQLSSEAKKTLLSEHNKCRRNAHADLSPLQWDDAAALFAQRQAEKCLFQHSSAASRRAERSGGLGENLAMGGTSAGAVEAESAEWQKVRVSAGFRHWCEEAAWYNSTTRVCRARSGHSCGHYTQVVWAATTHVGCAVALCPSQHWILVCNYAPPGNTQGKNPFNSNQHINKPCHPYTKTIAKTGPGDSDYYEIEVVSLCRRFVRYVLQYRVTGELRERMASSGQADALHQPRL